MRGVLCFQPEDDDKWDSESDIGSTPRASNDDLLQQKAHVPSPLAAVDAPAAAAAQVGPA